MRDLIVRFVNPTREQMDGSVFARHPWAAMAMLFALPVVACFVVGMLP